MKLQTLRFHEDLTIVRTRTVEAEEEELEDTKNEAPFSSLRGAFMDLLEQPIWLLIEFEPPIDALFLLLSSEDDDDGGSGMCITFVLLQK
ncbi:unnamed protein product [Camellia sinensis]